MDELESLKRRVRELEYALCRVGRSIIEADIRERDDLPCKAFDFLRHAVSMCEVALEGTWIPVENQDELPCGDVESELIKRWITSPGMESWHTRVTLDEAKKWWDNHYSTWDWKTPGPSFVRNEHDTITDPAAPSRAPTES